MLAESRTRADLRRAEQYFAGVNPSCPGEALTRTVAHDLPSAVVRRDLHQRGFHPRSQIIHTPALEPGRSTRTAIESSTSPDGVIADVVQTSATEWVVFVAPLEDLAATDTDRTIGERCSTVAPQA
jgi:hypothetical protein